LAGLLAAEQKLPEARRQVVLALEEAPRFRAAHQLLLEIAAKMDATPATQPTTAPPATTPPAAAP
jgi:hypothetical protein